MADASPAVDDSDLLLPDLQRRQWLVDRMGELVKVGGLAPLVSAPLLEPTEVYFPDPWAGGEASMRRLIRRLLGYAGLPDQRVAVTIAEDGPGGPAVSATAISPVWFDGYRDGRMHFSASSTALRSPLIVVPATARAVAEAWRAEKNLKVSDDSGVQQLIDVTAVYLGFGRLTLDAAIRHFTGAQLGMTSRRHKTRLGVISPMDLGFLLGIVAVVRAFDDKDVRAITKKMQPNPAAFFRDAVTLLRTYAPHICEQLALPHPDTWPPEYDLRALTAPLPDHDADAEVEAAEPERHADKGVVGMNVGQPVFRVERSKALRLAKMLALPVAMLGMVAGRMNLGVDVPMWQIGIAAGALGILGLGVGRLMPDSRCSEPKCGNALSKDDEVCPRCGGTVRGVIGHPKERLAAEEALRLAGDGGEASDDADADDGKA